MNPLVELALKSAWSRRVAVAAMIMAVALSTALLLAAQRLRVDVRSSFSQALSGTDLVVGARASPVQLVLYAVLRIGQPTQAVSMRSLEAIEALPQVAWVVPLALGDSFRGLPVVATRADYFQRVRVGRQEALRFVQGGPFGAVNEAVVGSEVARRFGLRLGGRLQLSHGSGVIETESVHDELDFKVAGVLAPTGGPIDRSVHISLEAMHALHAGWTAGVRLPTRSVSPPAPAAQPRAVSAALVGLHSRSSVFSVQRHIEALREEPLTAALPGLALDELWQAIAVAEQAVLAASGLVALASLAGLVSVLFAGLDARRRELAILRAVGAGPLQLAALLALEGLASTLVGLLLGLAIATLTLFGMGPTLSAQLGITLGTDAPRPGEWALLAAVLGTGMLASLLPAWRAWRLSLADGLSPKS